MIITEVRDKVNLRWRDDNNERLTETIDNFRHYFYVESKNYNKLRTQYTYKHWGQPRTLRPVYEQTEEKNIDDIDNLLPDSLLGPYPILNNNL